MRASQLTYRTNARLAAALCAVSLFVFHVGCNRNPYGTPYASGYPATSPFVAPPPGTWQVPGQAGAMVGATAPQLAELERRVQQLDVNNRQLTTQLAQSQQQMQVFRDRADLLQKQLQDTAAQLQQSRYAQQELQGQAMGLQASINQRGGAILRPNNSQPVGPSTQISNMPLNNVPMNSGSMNSAPTSGAVPGYGAPAYGSPATTSPAPRYAPQSGASLQSPSGGISAHPASAQIGASIPSATVEQRGNQLRIRVPADQLFAPNSAQLTPGAVNVIDDVARTVAQKYSRQRVTVESHTDSGSLYGGMFANQAQLSTAQAQAVLDQLIRRNGLPTQQFSVMSHGANYPRADNNTAAGRAENRRIEFVINTETF